MAVYLSIGTYVSNPTIGAIGSTNSVQVLSTANLQAGMIVRGINDAGTGTRGQFTMQIQSVDNSQFFTGRVLGGYPTDTGAGGVSVSGRSVFLFYDPDYQFCDANELVHRSECWDLERLSEIDREAIMLYARVKSLAAQTDGTDYSSNLQALTAAANSWKMILPENRRQLEARQTLLNANINSAGLSDDVNVLKTAAAAYRTMPKELREQVLAFLKCSLNSRGLSA